jgi:hypothetical protein
MAARVCAGPYEEMKMKVSIRDISISGGEFEPQDT